MAHLAKVPSEEAQKDKEKKQRRWDSQRPDEHRVRAADVLMLCLKSRGDLQRWHLPGRQNVCPISTGRNAKHVRDRGLAHRDTVRDELQ